MYTCAVIIYKPNANEKKTIMINLNKQQFIV